jgi:hypothetical protein
MKLPVLLVMMLGALACAVRPESPRSGTDPVIEVRTYELVPGGGAAFDSLVRATLPLLAQFDIEVVGHGPSLHDPDVYVLIRAFRSLEDRQRKEDAFYGSEEWVNGPREQVLRLIKQFTTLVLRADPSTITRLRASLRGPLVR